jgi:hypothetical protein
MKTRILNIRISDEAGAAFDALVDASNELTKTQVLEDAILFAAKLGEQRAKEVLLAGLSGPAAPYLRQIFERRPLPG